MTESKEYQPVPKERPKPKIKYEFRTPPKCDCPDCKRPATRHEIRQRTLHCIGSLSGRPIDTCLRYSIHYCVKCDKYFNINTTDLAAPRANYTFDVMKSAVSLVLEGNLTYRKASRFLWNTEHVFVSTATIQRWVKTKVWEKFERQFEYWCPSCEK